MEAEAVLEGVSETARTRRQVWAIVLVAPASEQRTAQDVLRSLRRMLQERWPDVDRRTALSLFDPREGFVSVHVDDEIMEAELDHLRPDDGRGAGFLVLPQDRAKE